MKYICEGCNKIYDEEWQAESCETQHNIDKLNDNYCFYTENYEQIVLDSEDGFISNGDICYIVSKNKSLKLLRDICEEYGYEFSYYFDEELVDDNSLVLYRSPDSDSEYIGLDKKIIALKQQINNYIELDKKIIALKLKQQINNCIKTTN